MRAAADPARARSPGRCSGSGSLSFALGDVCFDFVYGGSPPRRLGLRRLLPRVLPGLLRGARAARALAASPRFDRGVWLDGAIAALAAAAVSAAIVLQVVLEQHERERVGGDRQPRLPGRRPGAARDRRSSCSRSRATGPAGPGPSPAPRSALIAVADSLFLYLNATGELRRGHAARRALAGRDAAARASPPGSRSSGSTRSSSRGGSWRRHRSSAGSSRSRCWSTRASTHHNVIADALAAGAILTVFIRTALSFIDNARLLDARPRPVADRLR